MGWCVGLATPSLHLCGLAVPSSLFGKAVWVVGRSSRFQVLRESFRARCGGRLGPHNLASGPCFRGFLNKFTLLGNVGVELSSGGMGGFIVARMLPGCGLFVGARRGGCHLGAF